MDPKTGVEKKIIVSVDDGIRPNTNLADLAKLKPAFQKDGTTTAGTKEIFFINFVTLGDNLLPCEYVCFLSFFFDFREC